MKKSTIFKMASVAIAMGVLSVFNSCKKDEEATPDPVTTVADTDFQFTASFNGETYNFKSKTFDVQGFKNQNNLGALARTFGDSSILLLAGINAKKDDTLAIYFIDKTGASKASFALGNTVFPKVDITGPEPLKYSMFISTKLKDSYFCIQAGDNMTLAVTQSDAFTTDSTKTSILKGTFSGKVTAMTSLGDTTSAIKKQYDITGSYRALKIKD